MVLMLWLTLSGPATVQADTTQAPDRPSMTLALGYGTASAASSSDKIVKASFDYKDSALLLILLLPVLMILIRAISRTFTSR